MCQAIPGACVETGGRDPWLQQEAHLFRTQLGVTVGLPWGFQVGAQAPLELKSATSRWSLDGVEFTPGWAGHTHADGTAFGVGDVRAEFGISDTPAGVTGLVLGAWIGASVPTGRPPQDPAQRDYADPRQREFGTGTVGPTLRTMVFWTSKTFGLLAMGNARFTVYETPKGYRGSTAVAGAVGPTLLLDGVPAQLRLLVETSFLTPEAWHGQATADSGRASIGLSFGATVNLTPKLALDLGLQTRAHELMQGNQFGFPVTGTVGVTGFAGPPRKKQPRPPAP